MKTKTKILLKVKKKPLKTPKTLMI